MEFSDLEVEKGIRNRFWTKLLPQSAAGAVRNGQLSLLVFCSGSTKKDKLADL